MRLRTPVLAAVLAAGLAQSSDAVVHQKSADPPTVSADQGPRSHRTTGWQVGGAKLAATGLASWTAIWDRDTDVPLRLWGSGALAPGAVGDPAIAEAAARAFLAQHIAVLAPGSLASDFVVVANRLGGAGNTRSVGFEQRANGIRVLGGSIGMTFKHDRLTMVGSTALPNIAASVPSKRLAPGVIASSATAWLARDGYVAAADVAHGVVASERVIVPIVRPRRGTKLDITYRVAERITATSSEATPGGWDIWIDATTAAPIMRKNKLHFASGKVLFDVPDRYPGGGHSPYWAPNATHTVDGAAVTSTADGTITWNGNAAASVRMGLRGPLISVSNSGGSLVTETMTLQPAGTVMWSKVTVEREDAQLSAFVHASIAKSFAKTRLDPGLGWLDDTLSVVVNEGQTCNAYSTGDDIHFFRKGYAFTGWSPDLLAA